MRYEEFINNELENIKKAAFIDENEIPELNLYMDQVEKFFNKKFEALDSSELKRSVSKPLINNYTKRHMVARPDGKRYSNDHMVMIAMVIYLKSLFKLEKIEKVMKPLVENHQSVFDDKIDPKTLYKIARKVNFGLEEKFADQVDEDLSEIKKQIEDTDIADDELMEIFALILTLTMRAYMEKTLISKLIDTYFVEAAEENKNKIKPEIIKKKNRISDLKKK